MGLFGFSFKKRDPRVNHEFTDEERQEAARVTNEKKKWKKNLAAYDNYAEKLQYMMEMNLRKEELNIMRQQLMSQLKPSESGEDSVEDRADKLMFDIVDRVLPPKHATIVNPLPGSQPVASSWTSDFHETGNTSINPETVDEDLDDGQPTQVEKFLAKVNTMTPEQFNKLMGMVEKWC